MAEGEEDRSKWPPTHDTRSYPLQLIESIGHSELQGHLQIQLRAGRNNLLLEKTGILVKIISFSHTLNLKAAYLSDGKEGVSDWPA